MTRRTIGYHIVKTTYGSWLPGDARGHWSTAWDDRIGYVEPHALHEGDAVRERIAQSRMTKPRVILTDKTIRIVADTLAACEADSPWSIAAASIEPTHMHILMTHSPLDLDRTVKWLTQNTTKAVHEQTDHQGPIWTKGSWREFIFDVSHWRRVIEYIEQHNVRRGLAPRPYAFISESRI